MQRGRVPVINRHEQMVCHAVAFTERESRGLRVLIILVTLLKESGTALIVSYSAVRK